MTHIFTIPADLFPDFEVGAKRHLFTKDSAKYATNDKAILQPDDGRHQVELVITSVEHGPTSKHVNGHYCLLGFAD